MGNSHLSLNMIVFAVSLLFWSSLSVEWKKTGQKHKFTIHARILTNHVLPTTLQTCKRYTQNQDTHRFVR